MKKFLLTRSQSTSNDNDDAAVFVDTPSRPPKVDQRHAATSDAWQSTGKDSTTLGCEQNDRYRTAFHDEQFNFNELCSSISRKQVELTNAMKTLNERLLNVESQPHDILSESRRLNAIQGVSVQRGGAHDDAQTNDGVVTSSRSKLQRSQQRPTDASRSTPKRKGSKSVKTSTSPMIKEEATNLSVNEDRSENKRKASKKNSNKTNNNFNNTDYDNVSQDVPAGDSSPADRSYSVRCRRGSSLRVPRYNGEKFHVFKPMFEAVAKRYGWSAEEKCVHLQQSFRGKAQRILSAVPSSLWSYDTLMTEAENQSGETEPYVDTVNKMLAMTRRNGQSLYDFADAIHRLSRKTSMSNFERERLTRQVFVAGVNDREMQFHVEREDKEKDSLRKAVNIAVMYERDHFLERAAMTASQVTVNVNNADNDNAIDELNVQDDSIEDDQRQKAMREELEKLKEEIEQLRAAQTARESTADSKCMRNENEKSTKHRKCQKQSDEQQNRKTEGKPRFWQYVNGQYVPYIPVQQCLQYDTTQTVVTHAAPPSVAAQQPTTLVPPPPTTATQQTHAPVQQEAPQVVTQPAREENVTYCKRRVRQRE